MMTMVWWGLYGGDGMVALIGAPDFSPAAPGPVPSRLLISPRVAAASRSLCCATLEGDFKGEDTRFSSPTLARF